MWSYRFDSLDIEDYVAFEKSIMEFLIIICALNYNTLGYLEVKHEYPHIKCSISL